jgi:hypothetical protein
MSDFLQSMIEVFSSNLTLQEKLEQLIDKEFEFFMEHPELPMFILQSLHQNKTDAPMPSHFLEPIANTGIFEQFEMAKAKGEIRDISIRNMTMLLMSNVHYPFMSKKLTEQFHGIDAEVFEADLIKHKAIVKELIINYLFISNPKA